MQEVLLRHHHHHQPRHLYHLLNPITPIRKGRRKSGSPGARTIASPPALAIKRSDEAPVTLKVGAHSWAFISTWMSILAFIQSSISRAGCTNKEVTDCNFGRSDGSSSPSSASSTTRGRTRTRCPAPSCSPPTSSARCPKMTGCTASTPSRRSTLTCERITLLPRRKME